MAHNEQLAEHIREVSSREHGLSLGHGTWIWAKSGISQKRGFGGQAFLIHGDLAVSASGQGALLLRVDPAQTETFVADPNPTRAVMRGRAR